MTSEEYETLCVGDCVVCGVSYGGETHRITRITPIHVETVVLAPARYRGYTDRFLGRMLAYHGDFIVDGGLL